VPERLPPNEGRELQEPADSAPGRLQRLDLRIEGHTDRPIPFEDQRRRVRGTETPLETQFTSDNHEPVLSRSEQRRRFSADAESAADRQLERSDEASLDNAVAQLRRVEYLSPERWATADAYERQAALQEVNKVLGRSFGWGNLQLEFATLYEDGDTMVLGETSHDGAFTRINEKFLGSTDERFAQFDNPEQAIATVCHEYRHYYQEEQALTTHGPVVSNVPREIVRQWEHSRVHYVGWEADRDAYRQDQLERDSNNLARQLCERLYGNSST
jgi:hypothetical protein